jgi:hypothetical protein
MNKYVIKSTKKEETYYIAKRTFDKSLSDEFHYVSSDINEAVQFETRKEAKEAYDKVSEYLKRCWGIVKSNVTIKPVPENGLKLEDNETSLFVGNVKKPLEDNYWEKLAIKELTPKEALRELADFEPDPEHYKEHLRLYFWDTWENHRNWPTGGFYDGGFSSMYGYDHEVKKFITENLVGAYYHKDHAASYRIVDSGYLLPVEKNGKIRWINASSTADWIKYDGGKIEDIKPAFETSLKLEDFIASVNKHLKQGY